MEIILVVILLLLVVALFAVQYMKKKKFTSELSAMREDLKVGDKVLTDSGVVGEVVDSYVEEEYKYFVLKTGNDSHPGYVTVHANAIYYVFNKEEQTAQPAEKVVVKVAPKAKAEKPAEEVKK